MVSRENFILRKGNSRSRELSWQWSYALHNFMQVNFLVVLLGYCTSGRTQAREQQVNNFILVCYQMNVGGIKNHNSTISHIKQDDILHKPCAKPVNTNHGLKHEKRQWDYGYVRIFLFFSWWWAVFKMSLSPEASLVTFNLAFGHCFGKEYAL